MKFFNLLFLAIFALSPSLSWAKKKTVTESEAISQTPVTEKSYSAVAIPFGLGVGAVSKLTGTDTALVAQFDFSSANSVQAFAGIGGTSPFSFGLGGLFKRTIKTFSLGGFHLGGGLGLGSGQTLKGSAFFFSVAAIGGFHFSLPGVDRIQISVDAGPVLNVLDGTANLTLGGLSSALGLSLVYLF